MQTNGFTSGLLTSSGRTVQRAEIEGDMVFISSVSRGTFYDTAQPLAAQRARTLQFTLRERLQERMRR